MAADLAGPRPTATLDHRGEVDLATVENRSYAVADYPRERPMVTVGTVTVENEFTFARTADLPDYDACLYDAEGSQAAFRPASVAVVETEESWLGPVDERRLAGGASRDFEVVLLGDTVGGDSLADLRARGTVPVRRADRCPETTDGAGLVLVSARERNGGGI